MNYFYQLFLRKYYTPEKEAKFLVQLASASGFEVFLDQRFRELIDYKKQNKTEQDRIFNELEVTALIFLLAAIKDKSLDISKGRQEFWEEIDSKVQPEFIGWLKKLNIPKQFIEIWEKLVEMRLDEYEINRFETRQIFSEDEASPFNRAKNPDAILRIETLRVSCLLHLTRGQAKPDHPLSNYLRTWLIGLNNQLEKRIGW